MNTITSILTELDEDMQQLDKHVNHYGHNVDVSETPCYCTDCEVYLKGLPEVQL